MEESFMKVVKTGTSGTMESSDILVTVEESKDKGIHISLDSPVKKQFGSQIKSVVLETAKKIGVESANITIIDKGALDCVIRARTSTALYRACDSEDYKWEAK